MPTFYVAPSAVGPGNGSLSSPFKSWLSVTWATGNTELQKGGTTYAGVFRLTAGRTRLVGALTANSYGRGIELSSAAGPGAVSDHTIRNNTCRFNYNDGVLRCAEYGNRLANNEVNGFQQYGGGAPGRIRTRPGIRLPARCWRRIARAPS